VQEEIKRKMDSETSATFPSRVVRLTDYHLKTLRLKNASL